MSGFKKLSSDIRQEMLADAGNVERRQVFRAARRKSETMDLDEYIRFISEGMEYVRPIPKMRQTGDFRL
jgi:hypothetical protein